ncbi:hypothetical protein A9306_08950 [Moraxella atlantae]|mgnify:CR=1 FL=1|uniref:P2 phage tail completion protein R (GpR) n=1 Tax=Faucicola atlantae TaxID=34059 RepID=A0A1B8QD15_9GAMM|nr:hypothetical protein A9306_08950 [Moraxella atlantae]
MRLIQSLREHLLSKVQYLANNPDRLILTVEKGSLLWSGQSLSHRQQYTAVIEIDDYPESLDPNHIIVPLLDWYQQNQDPLPSNGKSPIAFASYVLSNASTTVVFTVDLQESIVVANDDKGYYAIDICSIPADNPYLNPLLKDLLKR